MGGPRVKSQGHGYEELGNHQHACSPSQSPDSLPPVSNAPEIIKQLYETRPFSDDVMANNIAAMSLDWPIALPGGVLLKDRLLGYLIIKTSIDLCRHQKAGRCRPRGALWRSDWGVSASPLVGWKVMKR